MATVSYHDGAAHRTPAARMTMPDAQRAAIGAAAGVMPVLLTIAVVQGKPVLDAVGFVAQALPVDGTAVWSGVATLAGFGVQILGFALLGVASAMYLKDECRRLDLFQKSIVAPALVFVAVQVTGVAWDIVSHSDDVGSAQIRISGVAADSRQPVSIVVYDRQPAGPVVCFVRGIWSRGC